MCGRALGSHCAARGRERLAGVAKKEKAPATLWRACACPLRRASKSEDKDKLWCFGLHACMYVLGMHARV